MAQERRTGLRHALAATVALVRVHPAPRKPGAPGAARAPEEQLTARQLVEQAVRTLADEAAHGLPGPWAQAVREAAVHGAEGLPEALDTLAQRVGTEPAPAVRRWWRRAWPGPPVWRTAAGWAGSRRGRSGGPPRC